MQTQACVGTVPQRRSHGSCRKTYLTPLLPLPSPLLLNPFVCSSKCWSVQGSVLVPHLFFGSYSPSRMTSCRFVTVNPPLWADGSFGLLLWASNKQLKLHVSKTELLIFTPSPAPSSPIPVFLPHFIANLFFGYSLQNLWRVSPFFMLLLPHTACHLSASFTTHTSDMLRIPFLLTTFPAEHHPNQF